MPHTKASKKPKKEKGVVIKDQLFDKPSTMFHGDLYTVRLYTDESVDGHVYTNVKHLWYKAKGEILCICHFYEDGTYRFVMWQMRQVIWVQMVPKRFDDAMRT